MELSATEELIGSSILFDYTDSKRLLWPTNKHTASDCPVMFVLHSLRVLLVSTWKYIFFYDSLMMFFRWHSVTAVASWKKLLTEINKTMKHKEWSRPVKVCALVWWVWLSDIWIQHVWFASWNMEEEVAALVTRLAVSSRPRVDFNSMITAAFWSSIPSHLVQAQWTHLCLNRTRDPEHTSRLHKCCSSQSEGVLHQMTPTSTITRPKRCSDGWERKAESTVYGNSSSAAGKPFQMTTSWSWMREFGETKISSQQSWLHWTVKRLST